MYGLLRGNGELIELPDGEEASLHPDVLICYEATGREVARYPASDSLFGNVEVLERLVPIFKRIDRLNAYERLERLSHQR